MVTAGRPAAELAVTISGPGPRGSMSQATGVPSAGRSIDTGSSAVSATLAPLSVASRAPAARSAATQMLVPREEVVSAAVSGRWTCPEARHGVAASSRSSPGRSSAISATRNRRIRSRDAGDARAANEVALGDARGRDGRGGETDRRAAAIEGPEPQPVPRGRLPARGDHEGQFQGLGAAEFAPEGRPAVADAVIDGEPDGLVGGGPHDEQRQTRRDRRAG